MARILKEINTCRFIFGGEKRKGQFQETLASNLSFSLLQSES